MDSSPVTSDPSRTIRCRNPALTMIAAARSRVQSGEANTTSEVRCAAGARVELGDLLVVLEPRK